MCLSTIDSIHIEPKDEDWKIGYKTVFKGDEKYGYNYSSPYYNSQFNIGVVQIDKSKNNFVLIYVPNLQQPKFLKHLYNLEYAYPCGFHIWKSFEDAKNSLIKETHEIIVKVKYRKVVASGMNLVDLDKYGYCDVAQEIEIVEELINN